MVLHKSKFNDFHQSSIPISQILHFPGFDNEGKFPHTF